MSGSLYLTHFWPPIISKSRSFQGHLPALPFLIHQVTLLLTIKLFRSLASDHPALVRVAKVELTDEQALVETLKGHDVALITLGGLEALERNSKAIVDAAIAAGVRRVLPSEYGK
jgi:hypothetical protein